MVGNIRRETSSTIQQTAPYYYLVGSDDYGIDGHNGDGDFDIGGVAVDDSVADNGDDVDNDDNVAGLHQVN